jgi:hypothetical protein
MAKNEMTLPSPDKTERERIVEAETEARKEDPDGVKVAGVADSDEPATWPSSDRQKMETTISRVKAKRPA